MVIDSWSLVGASMLGYIGHRSHGASRNTLPASATPQLMGSGSTNRVLHSINVSGYFSPIKMFNLFLNAYELWWHTIPCVKQSNTAHDI